jgi:D-psicose/D-tagatose/L-ribulose 3-epimerase
MASFGINLMLWPRVAEHVDAAFCSRIAMLGYDGIEIPIDPDMPERYRPLPHWLNETGLRCTCTGRGAAGASLISPDAEVRKAGSDRLRRIIEIAESLGAEVLGGPLYGQPGVFTGKAPSPDEVAWAIEGLQTASAVAATSDVVLCPEILNRFETHFLNRVEQAVAIAEVIDHPSFGIHYDTFHAHIEEASVADAITRGGRHIRHVHFSENDRGLPGTGQVRWSETANALQAVGYDGWIVVEAFSYANPPLAKAMRIWRSLGSSEWDFAERALTNMQDIWNGGS